MNRLCPKPRPTDEGAAMIVRMGSNHIRAIRKTQQVKIYWLWMMPGPVSKKPPIVLKINKLNWLHF